LLYTVPPFILGLPKIDLEDCVIYLVYQLRQASYEVRYSPPNMIYISWLHHEQSYIEQSPIMKAMIESSEKTQAELERKEKEASRLIGVRKSQRKIVKQMPGINQLNQTSQPNKTFENKYLNSFKPDFKSDVKPTAGPPRPSASDYIPPSSFLQNMTNPPNKTVYPNSVPEYFKR